MERLVEDIKHAAQDTSLTQMLVDTHSSAWLFMDVKDESEAIMAVPKSRSEHCTHTETKTWSKILNWILECYFMCMIIYELVYIERLESVQTISM